MVATQTTPAINSAFLFAQLNAKLKGHPELNKRVMAHIKTVSGHDSMAALINNGTPEEERKEILATCLRAIITKDLSKLKGESEPEKLKAVEQKKPEPPTIDIAVEKTQTVNTPPRLTAAPPSVDARLATVMAAVQQALAPEQTGQAPDESTTRRVVEKVVAEQLAKVVQIAVDQAVNELKFQLVKGVDEHVEKRMKKFAENVACFMED